MLAIASATDMPLLPQVHGREYFCHQRYGSRANTRAQESGDITHGEYEAFNDQEPIRIRSEETFLATGGNADKAVANDSLAPAEALRVALNIPSHLPTVTS